MTVCRVYRRDIPNSVVDERNQRGGEMNEVGALQARIAALEAEKRVLAAAVAVHNQMRLKIRDWWSFGKDRFAQEHTHSWHTREDFIAMWDKELTKAVAEASSTVPNSNHTK